MALDLSMKTRLLPLDLSLKTKRSGPIRPKAVRFRARDCPYSPPLSPGSPRSRGGSPRGASRSPTLPSSPFPGNNRSFPWCLQMRLGLGRGEEELSPSRSPVFAFPTPSPSPPRGLASLPRGHPAPASPLPGQGCVWRDRTSPLPGQGCVWRDRTSPLPGQIPRADLIPSPVTPDSLPVDPRKWDRADVQSWIHSISASLGLTPIPPEKFLMNGKALCLMTLPMFLYRVPDGGRSLYLDFRGRLAHALALEAACDN